MENKLRYTPGEFEQALHDFVAGKIPCELHFYGFFRDRICTDWLVKTAKTLRPVLQDLHSSHGILPSAVLYLLANEWWFLYEYKNQPKTQLDKILTEDSRGRAKKRSVKILEAAIREIEVWKPASWGLMNIDWTKPAITMQFHDSIDFRALVKDLTRLRDNIGELSKKIKKGRRQQIQARVLARNLSSLFQQFAERPLYAFIAELFALTWPQGGWQNAPGNDGADRIRKLVDEGPPPVPGPNLPLSYAIALQTRDAEYLEHWRRLDEQREQTMKARGKKIRAPAERRRQFEKEVKRVRAKKTA